MLFEGVEFFEPIVIVFGLEDTFEEGSDCIAIYEFGEGLLVDLHHAVLIPLGLIDKVEALQPFKGLCGNL